MSACPVRKSVKHLKGKLEKYSLPVTGVLTNEEEKFNTEVSKRTKIEQKT